MMNRRGVFWIIDDKLAAYLFDESAVKGIAKSGNNFNHKLLWEYVKPCNKPFDYYPRGRVEYDSRGAAILYMNPNIEEKFISEITAAFGITAEVVIRYDYSEHYKCCFDC